MKFGGVDFYFLIKKSNEQENFKEMPNESQTIHERLIFFIAYLIHTIGRNNTPLCYIINSKTI
jgi:hypothetical protein